MKTVLWIKDKGNKIITGFDVPVIDPVETRKIVNEKILETKETQEFISKTKAYSEKYKAANSAFKEGVDCLRRGDKKASDKKAEEYRGLCSDIEKLQAELKDMRPVLKEVTKELRLKHAVYLEPKYGETIIQEKEFLSLMKFGNNKKPDELVTVTGKVIKNPDYVAVVK